MLPVPIVAVVWSAVFLDSVDSGMSPSSTPHGVAFGQLPCFLVSSSETREAHVPCLEVHLCVAIPREWYELPCKTAQMSRLMKLHTYQEGVKKLIMRGHFGESMAGLPSWPQKHLESKLSRLVRGFLLWLVGGVGNNSSQSIIVRRMLKFPTINVIVQWLFLLSVLLGFVSCPLMLCY